MEEWRDVVGYEGIYQVSNLGNVRRSGNPFRAKNFVLHRQVKTCKGKFGYHRLNLYNNGVRKSYNVHTLVANAFIGKRPEGFDVDHKDGNKSNNSVKNLEYVTKKENKQRASKLGLIARGERNGWSILKNDDIIQIREMYDSKKYNRDQIANRFNISIHNVSTIGRRIGWKHI